METMKIGKTTSRPRRRRAFGALAGLAFGVLTGCNYDFPLTDRPTDRVHKELLGAWTAEEGKEHVVIRAFDEKSYLVEDNGQFYRMIHTDLGALRFLSIQELESAERRYLYVRWRLTPDGKELHLNGVNSSVVPTSLPSARAVRRVIKKNKSNPDLFTEEGVYTREESPPAR